MNEMLIWKSGTSVYRHAKVMVKRCRVLFDISVRVLIIMCVFRQRHRVSVVKERFLKGTILEYISFLTNNRNGFLFCINEENNVFICEN